MSLTPAPSNVAISVNSAKAARTTESAKAAPLKPEPSPKAASVKKPAATPRGGTKTDKILGLLKQSGGVTLQELVKATGWQPHSVRGFLSGTISKKMGTPVESFNGVEGDRCYRLSAK